MSAPRVQIQYQELRKSSHSFDCERDRVLNLICCIDEVIEKFKRGSWVGDNADQFIGKMEQQILPGLRRTADALAKTSSAMNDLNKLFEAAEERAAAILNGEEGDEKTDGLAYRIPLDQQYVSLTTDFVAYQPGDEGGAVDEDMERVLLLDEIDSLLVHGDYDDALMAIPELANMSEMSLAELQQLAERMRERHNLITGLIMTHDLYGRGDSPLPSDIYQMTPEQLHEYLGGPENLERTVKAFDNMVMWAILDPLTSANVRDQFYAMTPEERVDALISLSVSMSETPGYTPGLALIPETLPQPGTTMPPVQIVNLLTGSAVVTAFVTFAVSNARDNMMLATHDEPALANLLYNHTATHFAEDSFEQWLDNMGAFMSIGGIHGMLFSPEDLPTGGQSDEFADDIVPQGNSARGYQGDWPPEAPQGPKPDLDAPEAAEWRYQRYANQQAEDGRSADEVLGFEEWRSRYFEPAQGGGRPGRPGGEEQVAARDLLVATEGWTNVENVRIGDRYVDLVQPQVNANGGKDYGEVGVMLQNGLPQSRERIKLAESVALLGPNDTITFFDRAEPTRRITYRAGDDVDLITWNDTP